MIRTDISKPVLSLDFTIDDIHKIRKWHYDILKNATGEEKIAFYNTGKPDAAPPPPLLTGI